MSLNRKDPLLSAGKILTWLLMGITALVTLLLIGIIPALLLNQSDFAAQLAEAGRDNPGLAMTATIALLLLGAAVTATAFHFFQLLGRMIDTVGSDNPFTTENADRLMRMGWIALLFQLASFPIAALVTYLDKMIPSENLTVDFDFSLTGVLLALVLFILARLFRQGAAMREDLEGTV